MDLKNQILEALKYGPKLELLGGRGKVQNKKPSLGGVGIFSGTVQCLTDALLMGVNIIQPSRETACLGIG